MNGNLELVQRLQEKGYLVHVRHYRRMENSESYFDMNTIKVAGLQDYIDAYGGITKCELFVENENGDRTLVLEVDSKCNPKDRFVRRIGAHIALARALKEVNS